MRPTPVQRPRVPIWVGGEWPHKAPARRAARWDGAVLTTGSWQQPPTPIVVAEMGAYMQAHRRDAGRDGEPFEMVVGGSSPARAAAARDVLGPLAEAGATWWDERFSFGELAKFAAVRARIEQGPPSMA
jgi:alkanesulfonate monooxygenase SsuD/methylene tetrahydromethanopterin reductase-like flavin-dependent oxidoreductase (luciferase family)